MSSQPERSASRHHIVVFCLILMASAGCDQALKQVARTTLAGSPAISLVADAVRFELVSNPGSFLGLGAGLPPGLRGLIFLALVPLGLAVLCAVLLRRGLDFKHQLVGLALVAGGGLGNWLDRMLHGGAVTDFVSVGLGPVRIGVFNLADLAVILGAILVAIEGRRPPEAEDRPQEQKQG